MNSEPTKTIILSQHAPSPIGPYSQAIGFKDFIFCSGQIALDPKSGQIVSGDVQNHTEQIMKNIEAVLKAAGLGLNHIVKTTIYLTNMNDFTAVNEIYGKYFPKNAPARSTVAVSALPKGVPVEIEVIAHR